MNSTDEKSYRAAAERAFNESWKLINLRDGWRSAKVTTITTTTNDNNNNSNNNNNNDNNK
jgi:hypothetical protein